jgi:heme-degrading monooxygenase HmoA
VVSEGREQDFEKVFGRDGIWTELLRGSAGYRGSSLRMELMGWRRRYKVFDHWRSHEDFERFREQRQQEYEKFSLWVRSEGLVERETVLGSFYDEPDFDAGTGLVPM